ncbi:Clp protease ClpB [Algoriphagus sp. CAU 1675]|uniref:Clp protease ClpB n=1 Tax=Algoriphagus sp. CAU 1675 TaxID=3032597 RepID=UPI0023DBFA0A|nr:Clp protease ClpB [Algoriphagus sp. CAU 1675]MDF2156864.1 Clp protease ClpB [Algoriphagus sp. CAU 1675]
MPLLVFSLLVILFQTEPTESAKLEKLVNEREILFEQWQNSESKKSGIFGNRTKKDMSETNDWLKRIISKDNQIIEEIKLSGEIKSAVIGQEKEDYKTITLNLEQDVQTLKRALADRDKTIAQKVSERRTFEWISLIFFLSTLGLGLWVKRLYKRI